MMEPAATPIWAPVLEKFLKDIGTDRTRGVDLCELWAQYDAM